MSLIPTLPPNASRTLAAIGLEPQSPPVRRTLDGNVDFDWYLGRANRLRAQSYARLFRDIGHGIRAVYTRIARALKERGQRRRALAELLSLDDRALRDMGLSRAGVYFAIDHGREDVPGAANVNSPARSPRAA